MSAPAPSVDASGRATPIQNPQTSSPEGMPSLKPGTYNLTLVAKRGSRKGASSQGRLILLSATASDTSPVTGKVAQDSYGPPWFYGWTDVDFQRIAAPICTNSAAPDPTSRDPMRPGALVPSINLRGQTMVLIGTLWNLRDGSQYVDGCGIALSVENSAGNCYRGSWDRWGIVANGSGSFRACAISGQSNR
jgi:hypothetical protein